MFKMCCGDCGECWGIGNPRTCKCTDECTDEKPVVWDASASFVMTPNPAFAKRKWVGLTDEEVQYIADSEYEETFVRLIEAKLKEKNT